MNEIKKPFSDVLSDEQIHNLHVRCGYDENSRESYFICNDFINGYALIYYGEGDVEYGTHYSNVIDTNGNFIDVTLDRNIKYSNGEIIKLNDNEKGRYYFEISRIREVGRNIGAYFSDIDTDFFVIKVTKCLKGYENDTYYVINPQLNVIATFLESNMWGQEFNDRNNICHTECDFYFINEERDFLIFSQKIIGDSEEIMQKIVIKYKDKLDFKGQYTSISSEKYIPHSENCIVFYWICYGIIDCKIKSAKQLQPFTDNNSVVKHIIQHRQENNENQRFLSHSYGQGWDYEDKHFYGYIMYDERFRYPLRVKGFTLKYLYEFYPNRLEWMSDHGLILIPNNLLDTLGNSEITRHIRLNQEMHLSYSKIESVSDCLSSTEYNGIVSSYQGKTISQIIYKKGGTKYLACLLKAGKLYIEKSVLEELLKNAFNDIEEKCYGILISTINNIELKKERYNDWLQRRIDEDNIIEVNRQFNGMMSDFDAWGNID
ncbi:hypothetical protein [Phocaeicola plebeius]|uniref:hypothetical protein n=1 Tax=Phocaeicola plebeius TaxID=310297 RepID=UPI0026EA4B1F|nr:hypothetical protein [Phocaeicola plebeius]